MRVAAATAFSYAKLFAAAMLLPVTSLAGEAGLLDAFETVWPWRPLSGRPSPSLKLEKDGFVGKCLRVRLPRSAEPQFVGRAIQADSSWTQAGGLSFVVKGDGSESFVSVTLIDESLTKRYGALLSLKSRGWQRVRLRWEDVVPEIITADWMGSPGANMKPEKVRSIWFGRWHYLRPWSDCTFRVDDLRLEPVIEAVKVPVSAQPGIPRTLAKLKSKKQVTIVALGDSVTFGTDLEDRDRDAYPAVLERLLRKHFGYGDIRVLNKGVGGIETRQGILLLPRDVAALSPDLVMTHFGYNDHSSMEGKPMSAARRKGIIERDVSELARRILLSSRGQAEVLLIATIPGGDEAHRKVLRAFGDAARQTARALGCGFSPGPRDAFDKAWASGKIKDLFGRHRDGRLDPAHLNAAGHRAFAEALAKAFKEPDRAP